MIDEAALVDRLRDNPMFRVGLDVFEVFILIFHSLSHLKISLITRMWSFPSEWMTSAGALNDQVQNCRCMKYTILTLGFI